MPRKRGRGRPPKDPALKQSKQVAVRLTPSEWQEASRRAKDADLTLAGYLRIKGLTEASEPS